MSGNSKQGLRFLNKFRSLVQRKKKKRIAEKLFKMPVPRGPPPRHETCRIFESPKPKDRAVEQKMESEEKEERKLGEEEEAILEKIEDLWSDLFEEILEENEAESKQSEEDSEVTERIEEAVEEPEAEPVESEEREES